jgi:hypothetical protein
MRPLLTAATLFVLALPLAGGLACADDKPADEVKPADLPLKAKLVVKMDTYKLDLGGKSADEFRAALKDAEKAGKAPEAPMVDLALEITNTGKDDVKFWVEGDPN